MCTPAPEGAHLQRLTPYQGSHVWRASTVSCLLHSLPCITL